MAGESFKEIMSGKKAEAKAPPAQEQAPRKIGEGHAKGMARLGFHELTNALQAFPDSNIKPMEEPGVFGNENAPQRISQQEKTVNKLASRGAKSTQLDEKAAKPANDTGAEQKEPAVSIEPPMETSLKEILNAPTPPMTPTVERDLGREM